MTDPAPTRSTRFGPGRERPESREETVAHATGGPAEARRAMEDETSRRGIWTRLARVVAVWGALGLAGGVVLGIVLQLVGVPVGAGSGDLASAGEKTLFVGLLGIAVGVVAGLVGALLTLAREDGRVAAEVEHRATR
jgi:hypothetical protein